MRGEGRGELGVIVVYVYTHVETNLYSYKSHAVVKLHISRSVWYVLCYVTLHWTTQNSCRVQPPSLYLPPPSLRPHLRVV